MMNYQVELLAPAGNMEAFKGAIYAGADAVYLGGDKFGARAYADNFSTQELVECIRYAHLFGKKVYLTVNTLMKEEELSQLYDYIKPFYEAGLDCTGFWGFSGNEASFSRDGAPCQYPDDHHRSLRNRSVKGDGGYQGGACQRDVIGRSKAHEERDRA